MDDLISREAAIDAVGYYSVHSGDKLLFADNALKKLPSAQPEQKTARWVRMKDSDDGYCSNCKCDMPLFREDWESWKYCATEFCPNCGAKMVNWEGMEGEAE